MLDASRLSSATPRAAPASRDTIQVEARPDADHAERFDAALARQKNGKGKTKAFEAREVPASMVSPLEVPAELMPALTLSAKEDKQGSPDPAMASTGLPHTERHEAAHPEVAASPGFAGQELTAQFAARLELPQTALVQSQVFLDERHYTVSNVVIVSEPGTGLSVFYESSSDTDPGNRETDEALQRRLEARGLKVDVVGQASRQ